MCGIAGLISFDSRFAPDEAVLRGMSTCIAHRGPDGEGIEVIQGTQVTGGLIHRRLAILDPDPRSNQPFAAEYLGRKLWITFNGEIYNYRELRRRLEVELPEFPWRTTGDTEVLLASYFAWGEKCVNELLGMFALVILDEQAASVFAARDRMGQKPLYYALAPDRGAIAFASELASLTRVPWVDLNVSDDALMQYLSYGYIAPPDTIYAGVRKLPAATCLMLTRSSVVFRSYFDPNAPVRKTADPVGEVRQLLSVAVESQLVSDVPLGCFLSGGIDSSIVSLLASQSLAGKGGGKLRTFTARFEDSRYDESAHAEQVARHLDTDHHTFTISPDAAEDLPTLAKSYGEPYADSSCLPTYYLARETRHHVKVALAGDGGDELFAGYDRYRAMALAEKIGFLGHLAGPLAERLAGGHPKSRLTRIGRFLAAAQLTAPKRYEAWVRLFPPGMLGSPPLSGSVAGVPLPSGDSVTAALALDRMTYLEGDLHTKVDRASMLVNLEVRAPFMDHHLVGFAASLSRRDLLTGGKKGLLRRAFAHELPAAVFKRKKMGFAVPIGEWFRTSLRDMLTSYLLASNSFCIGRFGAAPLDSLLSEHQTGQVDHTQRLFALLMLELWHQNT